MSHVFKLSPSLAVERIIEQGSGNVVPRGTQATRTPQIFLKDGSSFIVKPVSPRLPAYVTYPDGPDGAALVEWLDNRENYNTIGISFTLRPGDSPLLAGNVACESPDHAFAGGRPVKVITNSMIPLAASTFTGSGRLILEEMYVPDGSKGERFEKTITLNVRTKEEARHPITWLATPKRPGHYHGQYQLIKDGAVLRSSSFYILYGAETDKAESRPEDFDAFWQRTMAQLTAMPATFKRLKSTERKGQLASRITFKTIDDRGAWGRLTEPKEDGSYPAILELPAVFHHYGGKLSPSRRKGFVTLGCDVMGFDPDMLDPFSSEGRAIYQPWQKSTVSRPEDFWLYYAYCTIARAYDILANHPKVDSRRIYITGLSQGGGLTIAAAGLRPQNAGALSIVPGICRIAWASPSKGRGAWGPRFQVGPDYERMARMAQYFETAHLARNIRSRFVMFIGLLDDHTPPYAAATVFHYVPKRIRERKLIVDPWSHHTGRSDLHTFIPRWVREDSTSR
jgi:cephalosporin-C deacetylase